jgi:hypothetical protein
MAIWVKIKKLKVKEVFILVKTFLWRPRLIFPTYKATKETVQICNNLFGNTHHKNNKANAFRHALWNFKIAAASFPKLKDKNAAVAWAKEITTLHEQLSPNLALPKAMDLHNNEVGRKLFQQEITSVEIIDKLKQMMEEAKKVTSEEELAELKYKLVYIENDVKTN